MNTWALTMPERPCQFLHERSSFHGKKKETRGEWSSPIHNPPKKLTEGQSSGRRAWLPACNAPRSRFTDHESRLGPNLANTPLQIAGNEHQMNMLRYFSLGRI